MTKFSPKLQVVLFDFFRLFAKKRQQKWAFVIDTPFIETGIAIFSPSSGAMFSRKGVHENDIRQLTPDQDAQALVFFRDYIETLKSEAA